MKIKNLNEALVTSVGAREPGQEFSVDEVKRFVNQYIPIYRERLQDVEPLVDDSTGWEDYKQELSDKGYWPPETAQELIDAYKRHIETIKQQEQDLLNKASEKYGKEFSRLEEIPKERQATVEGMNQNRFMLLSKIYAHYPDLSSEDEDYLNDLPTDKLISEIKNRGWESLLEESLNEYWDKIEDTPYYKVASKSVMDSDGFWTEYTMYYDEDNNNYFFIFGDSDLYGPDPNYADWECDSNEEAVEWYNNYNGFEDEEDDSFEVEFDESVKKHGESLNLDDNLFEDYLNESEVKKYSVEEWIDSQGWAPDDVDEDEVAFYATDDGPVCGSKHKDGTYSVFGMGQDTNGLSYRRMIHTIQSWSNIGEGCDLKRKKSHTLNLEEDLFEDDVIIPDAIPDPELPEVVTESEPKEETPVMGPDFGIAGLLNKLIVDNWSMNDSYNELIANAESNNMSDIADLVKGIAAEVNNHIGKLQGALATISPNVENISVGEEEAIKELEPQTVEVEAEEIKENYSTELNDRVNSAYSTEGPERTSTIVSTVEKSLNDMHQGMKVDLNGATFERIPEGFKDVNTGNKWDTHVLMDMVNSTLGKDGKPPVFSDGK